MGASKDQTEADLRSQAITDVLALCGKISDRLEEAAVYWPDATPEIDQLFMSAEHSLQFLDGDVKMLQAKEMEIQDA